VGLCDILGPMGFLEPILIHKKAHFLHGSYLLGIVVGKNAP